MSNHQSLLRLGERLACAGAVIPGGRVQSFQGSLGAGAAALVAAARRPGARYAVV